MGEPKPATGGDVVWLYVMLVICLAITTGILKAKLDSLDARLDAICAAVQCETPAPTGEPSAQQEEGTDGR